MPLSTGAEFQATLLRPLPWLEAHGVEAGGSVRLDILELRKRGTARVVEIAPCPPIEELTPGHRVVTGTFVTTEGRVLDLRLEGADESLGTTATHPFWSVDRQCWVPAGCLAAGERIALDDGEGRVAGVTPRAATATVFNVEVRGDHTYFVGEDGAWVHNSHAARGSEAFSKEKQALVEMAKRDKRTGMTNGDMQAYKNLNKGLPDPFPANKVRGPEIHSPRTPNSPPGPGQQPHGHVGPVNHIPINGGS